MIDARALQPIATEFEGANLRDARLSHRLVRIGEQLLRNPAAGFPEAFGGVAELEAFYRFVNNPRFAGSAILEPHRAATMRRAGEAPVVLAIHDSSDIDYGGETPRKGLGIATVPGRLGYVAHVTLLIREDNSLPLGVANVETLTRTGTKRRVRGKLKRAAKGDPTRESLRWLRGVDAVEDHDLHNTEVIHVMDAEADFLELLDHLRQRQCSFVVRMAHRARIVEQLDGVRCPLAECLSTIEPKQSRTIVIQQRKPKKRSKTKFALKRHPPRTGRQARIAIGSTTLVIGKTQYSGLNTSVQLNVVRAWEPEPPPGEEPVDWVLFTNQPASTQEQRARVVDLYQRRWTIEDFFKALKTGCSIEKRQLESHEALRRTLMLFVPIAYRLLLLRGFERTAPDAPATTAFTSLELSLLAKAPATRNHPPPKTVQQALLLLARLGGHLKHNGPPGWLTLTRGLVKLLSMVEAVEVFLEIPLIVPRR